MNDTPMIEPVRISVRVKAPVAHAFELFTSGIERWWPRHFTIGMKPILEVIMEPRLGGRWRELAKDGSEMVVGTIIVWEPPHRFAMLWQIDAQWQADVTMKSEVDVRFAAEDAGTTLVELMHHRFETMGAEGGGRCARMSTVAGQASSSASCARPTATSREGERREQAANPPITVRAAAQCGRWPRAVRSQASTSALTSSRLVSLSSSWRAPS